MLRVNGFTLDPLELSVPRAIPNRLRVLPCVVAVAQLLDLATFVPAVARVGIGAESNPMARALYLNVGPLGPAALKAAAIVIILLVLARIGRRFPAYVRPAAALGVGIGLCGFASNVAFGLLR